VDTLDVIFIDFQRCSWNDIFCLNDKGKLKDGLAE
jgi:hypothetical protein